MRRLVIPFNLFSVSQRGYLYENDTHVRTFSLTTSGNFLDTLVAICNRYSINELCLKGNKTFLMKYASDLKTKYGLDTLKVDIIDM